jgi:2,3-bisphosphoglycerate-dependent phosphoglycerate mutase
VLPYYEAAIWPEVKAGRNVLVSAHGNSLRALIMRLEGLTGEEIVARELATGMPIVYRLKADGTMQDRIDLVPRSIA